MTEQIDVVIVGGGQAGLAVSHELTQAGVAHVVLERGRVGQTWRGWWDSFCLMAPNWTVQLPGHPYDGDDPDGFMARDDVVAYLERYAAGVRGAGARGRRRHVDRARRRRRVRAETSAGQIAARTVVLGTGAYQRPRRPAGAATLPADLLQIDVAELPQPRGAAGRPGARGRQRPVGLSDRRGAARGGPRGLPRLRARAVGAAQDRRPRRHLVGRRDRVLRRAAQLAAASRPRGWPATCSRREPAVGTTCTTARCSEMGVTLLGHFLGADGRRARFAPDLGDERRVGRSAQRAAHEAASARSSAARGLPAPQIDEPPPFSADAPEELDLSRLRGGHLRQRVSARLRVLGARAGRVRRVRLPDPARRSQHARRRACTSSACHFLRKRKSALLIGVGEDAADRRAARSPRHGCRRRVDHGAAQLHSRAHAVARLECPIVAAGGITCSNGRTSSP